MARCTGTAARRTNPTYRCRSVDSFTIGVIGDLHLEPGNMQLHEAARQQFVRQLAGAGRGARIVQLGDLGGYNSRPGSRCVRFRIVGRRGCCMLC